MVSQLSRFPLDRECQCAPDSVVFDIPRPKPAYRPDRPRTSGWSGFQMQLIQIFVGSHETLQS
jgi:hypothetical protein